LSLNIEQVEAGASAHDFLVLLKPRVMSLVVFTGLVGLALAPGHIHPFIAFVALLCIAVGAGASGALNMWFDADIDALMERTRARPVPQGRIGADEACGFGLVLSIASVMTMGLAVNWLAAGLLAFTIFFYVVIYTMWLKRSTPQNIVIGGAAGALPPVIGWAAVTGHVEVPALALFTIIFLWTPPHFWSLALNRREDYARAGVPMMPVVSGETATRRQIALYSVVMVASTVAPIELGFAGPLYAATALCAGAGFLLLAMAVATARRGASRRLFGFSILYLFALFASLLVERWAGVSPLVT